jgi:hypothetical protein
MPMASTIRKLTTGSDKRFMEHSLCDAIVTQLAGGRGIFSMKPRNMGCCRLG